MDRTERFQIIDRKLKANRYVRTDVFISELGISKSTFTRDIEYMRERLHAPIEYSRDDEGYFYNLKSKQEFHLPGFWLNQSEIYALLSMQNLIENIQPGLLSDHIELLKSRLNEILDADKFDKNEIKKRIKLVHTINRPVQSKYFEKLACATLERKKVVIRHHNRGQDTYSDRELSPQQMVFYARNWYLDSWCHQKNALRSFAIDAIEEVSILDDSAQDINQRLLDNHFKRGFGIFAGSDISWAHIRFTPESARWIGHESWHPDQRSRFDPEGYYHLEIPYSHDKELVMEILRHGEQAEVISPPELRDKLCQIASEMVHIYRD